MSASEVSAFESNLYFKEAVGLRLWDDAAKVPGLETPALQTYIDLIESAASKNSRR
jgi:predicted HD phosphohydrolase